MSATTTWLYDNGDENDYYEKYHLVFFKTMNDNAMIFKNNEKTC